MAGKKVPSPMWQALSDLNTEVQKDLATVNGSLKDADKRMAGGKGAVWVGPTARTWAADLTGAANDVTTQANAFAAYVSSELAAHPKEVTQAEADSERRVLSGRMR
ncbi:hypothetical protein SAMN05216223_10967 [Actinacidiphila yanglinensis]|uniref:WXG100 family type VII secretion target n=1 Tax=Actinacidiphila yanglinensis TaxID=310779 RepID=A0A1H6CK51_9ACTN|nr:hypothetical protein [Actinacidiphila yanglinensis]SEG73065.1 hypothetical protein SAMN05216223_10967 [Actinacidiphila yanglinensis]